MTEAMSFQHVPHVVAQAAIVLVRQSHQRHFEDLGRADGRQQVRALFVELHTGVPRVLFVHEEKPADTAAVWFRAGGALSDGGVTAFHGGRAGKGLHLGGGRAARLALLGLPVKRSLYAITNCFGKNVRPAGHGLRGYADSLCGLGRRSAE